MGLNLVLNFKFVFNEFYLISKVEVCVYDNVCNMVFFVWNRMILVVLIIYCKFV